MTEEDPEIIPFPGSAVSTPVVAAASMAALPVLIVDRGKRRPNASSGFSPSASATRTRLVTRAAPWFFNGRDGRGLEPHDIESLQVAAYVENFTAGLADPSVKQHLVAIRMVFDWLVTGQIVIWCGLRSTCASASKAVSFATLSDGQRLVGSLARYFARQANAISRQV